MTAVAPERPRTSWIPTTPALLAVAALGVVVWATAPILSNSSASVIPRLTHGVAIAILLAARGRDRTGLVLALWATIATAALMVGGPLARVIAASAMVVSQAIIVTLIFERLCDDPPLETVAALTRFFAATIVGCIPIAMLGSLVGQTVATTVAPDHDWVTWWITASASSIIFVPITLVFTLDAARRFETGVWHRIEFVVLFVTFAVVLVDVFSAPGLGLGLRQLPHVITTLPFLVWAAVRFGVPGVSVTALLLVITMMGSTAAGTAYADFSDSPVQRLQVAAIFLAVVIGSVMLFAVAIAQREAEERRTEGAYAQLSAIVEGTGDLIAAIDTDFTIVAVNPAWIAEWKRLSGSEARTGLSMAEVLAARPTELEASMLRWQRALAGEQFVFRSAFGDAERVREEYEITYSPVRGPSGQIVGAAQVVRNVTERRRREAEEAEARRLESVGRLAGGVAHDFNNLMTAVTGYTSLVAGTLEPGDPRRDDLHEIERAAVRAGELTQQLLAFARRRAVEPKLVDAGALVNGFSRLLAPLLGKHIVLVVHTARDLRQVRVDPTQFEQVVMNLAINARDAMGGTGQLRIEVLNDERDAVAGVSLVVRDTGTGMTDEVKQRIFEPFFTTKPLGLGTGLGLPTVHGIVHQAGGHIDVESAVGVGTTFRVFFPAAAVTRESERVEPKPVAPTRRALHTP